MHLEALLQRGDAQRIGPRAFLLGRAEHRAHLVASREERLEDRLAEILLADDRDFHYAAFFGGTLKAPAPFRFLIFESS